MSTNTPGTKPELTSEQLDFPDCRPGCAYPQADLDDITSPEIKQKIAERKAQQEQSNDAGAI